jgi:N-acetylgalactosamine-6-sulfatase
MMHNQIAIRCWLILAVILSVFARSSSAADRPNIVFILADDLGYGDLACYGHPYAQTPNLDRLAAEGTRYEQFYVAGVTCCPSRTGFMTGQFPARFARYPADFGFGDQLTVTQMLHNAGYRTGHFGKWHIGPNNEPGTYGIDNVNDADTGRRRRDKSERGRDAHIFDQAITFIEECASARPNQPFYVNVWGHITHFPVNPPEAYAAKFKSVNVDESMFSPFMQEKFAIARELGSDVSEGMRQYLGDVYSLDEDCGRLLAKLDELGLRDTTLVVFSSDQGAAPVNFVGKQKLGANEKYRVNMLGSSGPLRGGKHTQFEGGVRVPYIVRWPGHIAPSRVDSHSVIAAVDWLPTLSRITGASIDPAAADLLDGEDISDAYIGSGHQRTKPLFWKSSNENARVTVREGKWKLHHGRRPREAAQLFDISLDPEERNNVAATHPHIVKDLEAKIDAWNATLPRSYEKVDK